LKFDIKLLRIQSELDAAEEMYRELDRRAESEKTSIKKFLADNHITEQPDVNGMYVVINSSQKAALIDSGKTVFLNFTGKFLSGEVFDSNDKLGKPFSFKLGSGQVMKGWDIAFRKLHQGDKATLVIPSALAFGEDGLRNKMNGAYTIQPNTPLLYEVEIIAVK
jgi:FKBP-type peptidyl-prolyl cis-trans isomerase